MPGRLAEQFVEGVQPVLLVAVAARQAAGLDEGCGGSEQRAVLGVAAEQQALDALRVVQLFVVDAEQQVTIAEQELQRARVVVAAAAGDEQLEPLAAGLATKLVEEEFAVPCRRARRCAGCPAGSGAPGGAGGPPAGRSRVRRALRRRVRHARWRLAAGAGHRPGWSSSARVGGARCWRRRQARASGPSRSRRVSSLKTIPPPGPRACAVPPGPAAVAAPGHRERRSPRPLVGADQDQLRGLADMRETAEDEREQRLEARRAGRKRRI